MQTFLCTLTGLLTLGGTLAAQGTTRISVDSSGAQSNGQSDSSSMSADGRYVVFASFASNLVTGDTNGYEDIFRYDRLTGQVARVSVCPWTRLGSYGSSSSITAVMFVMPPPMPTSAFGVGRPAT